MKKLIISSLLCLGFIASNVVQAEAKGYYYKFNEKGSKINFYIVSTLHSPTGEINKFKGFINIKADENDQIEKADGLLQIDSDSLFTNQSMRDSKMKSQVLEVTKFPLIKFKVNDAKITHNNIKENNTLDLVLIGPLTIHGNTRNVQIPVKVKLSPDKSSALVDGKFTVDFKDYGVPDPSLPLIGKVDENINVTFSLKAH